MLRLFYVKILFLLMWESKMGNIEGDWCWMDCFLVQQVFQLLSRLLAVVAIEI